MMLVDETKLSNGVIELIGTEMGIIDKVYYWDTQSYRDNIEDVVKTLRVPRENNASNGQRMVRYWLQEHKIPYKEEYSAMINGHRRRFDFAIFDERGLVCFIEYDGEQHYKPVAQWGGEEGLKERQRIDKEKDAWAEETGRYIIRVPYWIKRNELDDFIWKEIRKRKEIIGAL